MTKVELAGDAPVKLRVADASGRQGRNWALASMLPEGTTSWDLTAVAGADTASADPRTRRWGSDGSIVLADSHYSTIGTVTTTTEWKGDRVVNLEGSLFWWGTTVWSASRPGRRLKCWVSPKVTSVNWDRSAARRRAWWTRRVR